MIVVLNCLSPLNARIMVRLKIRADRPLDVTEEGYLFILSYGPLCNANTEHLLGSGGRLSSERRYAIIVGHREMVRFAPAGHLLQKASLFGHARCLHNLMATNLFYSLNTSQRRVAVGTCQRCSLTTVQPGRSGELTASLNVMNSRTAVHRPASPAQLQSSAFT